MYVYLEDDYKDFNLCFWLQAQELSIFLFTLLHIYIPCQNFTGMCNNGQQSLSGTSEHVTPFAAKAFGLLREHKLVQAHCFAIQDEKENAFISLEWIKVNGFSN